MNVLADYVSVGKNNNFDEFFYDPDTLAKNQDIVRFWTYINFNKSTSGMNSFRAYEEVDCKNRTSLTLSAAAFSGPNLTGKIIETWTPEPKIGFIAPETIEESLMMAVCK